jgi:hypothetical protein
MTTDSNSNKDELDVMTVDQVAEELGVNRAFVLRSLASTEPGSLKGRNLKGPKGWVTTRRAMLEWVESGNHQETSAV